MTDNIVGEILTNTTFYVDPVNGAYNNDALTLETATNSISRAVNLASNGYATIYVLSGKDFNNGGFGDGSIDNSAAVNINNRRNLILRNYPGHRPKIVFDGSGGISVKNSESIEIRGFEIEGPNQKISYEEALGDRLLHSNYFSGRGIAVWSGCHHIRITHNKVHDCPNSGIRMNQADYGVIINNEVYRNTWWSSNAESGIVFADSRSIDESDEVKLAIINNVVYDNYNQIPYYNSNYDDPQYLIDNQMHVARENYGSSNQTFIIDGSGVYITRNSANYLHGKFQLSNNVAIRNGINGVVVHKTNNAVVFDNEIIYNGMVSRDLPEDRQKYAGFVINSSENVTFYDNNVVVYFSDDAGYAMTGTVSSVIAENSRDNSLCGGSYNSNLEDYLYRDGQNCADEYLLYLDEFLEKHNIVRSTTAESTTTKVSTTEVPGIGNTNSCTGNTPRFGKPSSGQCLTNLTQSKYGKITNSNYNPVVWSPNDTEWNIDPVLKIYKCPSSNKRIIKSNGIPNHDIVIWNPNQPCEQFWQIELPLYPENDYSENNLTELPRMNIQAIALSGIPIYGATESGGTNAVEGGEVADAGFWYGHAAIGGIWHYHTPKLGEEVVTEHGEDTLLGFAMDGFPLYGPVADDSILDECNGRFLDANDPSSYRYHTRHAGQIDSSLTYCQSGSSPVNNWRYILGCYKGNAENTIVRTQYNMWGNIPQDCVEDMELEGLAAETDILAFLS